MKVNFKMNYGDCINLTQFFTCFGFAVSCWLMPYNICIFCEFSYILYCDYCTFQYKIQMSLFYSVHDRRYMVIVLNPFTKETS